MNIVIFRAYDIRGKYPEEINEATVARITEALGRVYRNKKIIVAHDTRLSSPSLYKTILKSLPPKTEIIPVGIATSPMLYFLVNNFKANLGIMVTASHNPKEYNGLKIVKEGAVSIRGKEVLEMITNHS